MSKFERLRGWLLIKIANGKPVAINLHLKNGLYIDANKTKDGTFYNINISGGDYGFKID